MKKNEIVIGCTYNSVKFNMPVTCTLHDFRELYVMCEGTELDSEIIAEMFEPIELTEEWLIKFGFNEHGAIFIGLDVSSQDLQITVGGDVLIYDDNEDFISLNEVKYVHQLQNLYHSLTGNELTIS